MHRFNQALVGLYDLAEHASHNDFPVEALNLLQPWIRFDGAVLWMREIDAGIVINLLIAHVHVHHGNKTIFGNYTRIAAMDPVIKNVLDDLERPIQWDCRTLHQQDKAYVLEDFVQGQELRQVMLFGENQTAHKAGRWIMLYRGGETPFNALETTYLHTAWFHLTRALDINRCRVLDRHDTERVQRASALIDARGFIMVADYHFHSLLYLEWPDHQVRKRLPPAVVDNLKHGDSVFRGRRIEIVMAQQAGYLTCSASPIDMRADLTPSEYMVARRYATGLSHKEIARELGVSPHTVRNQIAQLYDKLGVHDKAMLAQRLARHIAHRKSTVKDGN